MAKRAKTATFTPVSSRLSPSSRLLSVTDSVQDTAPDQANPNRRGHNRRANAETENTTSHCVLVPCL